MTFSRLVVLYGVGGLSDIGRHAVQAALERADVESIVVLTQQPELLQESNWNCGCEERPHEFSEADKKRLTVVPVKSWKTDDLVPHFAGATGVVSCLGNRQPFTGAWVSNQGNAAVIRAMKDANIKRAVVISSMGVEEDWPPMEFHWGGKILAGLFMSIGWFSFRDLTLMERAYRASDIDFLFVRPVGLGEDIVPKNEWFIQKEKYKDVVGGDIAKLDVARYMVEECIKPTLHKGAAVVGGRPLPPQDEN